MWMTWPTWTIRTRAPAQRLPSVIAIPSYATSPVVFFFHDTAPPEIYTLSLHDALPISSGHAMGSTVVLGAVSYLAFRTATRWRWKTACLALAWTLILGIALSRVYLGVHWSSDVAAGI